METTFSLSLSTSTLLWILCYLLTALYSGFTIWFVPRLDGFKSIYDLVTDPKSREGWKMQEYTTYVPYLNFLTLIGTLYLLIEMIRIDYKYNFSDRDERYLARVNRIRADMKGVASRAGYKTEEDIFNDPELK